MDGLLEELPRALTYRLECDLGWCHAIHFVSAGVNLLALVRNSQLVLSLLRMHASDASHLVSRLKVQALGPQVPGPLDDDLEDGGIVGLAAEHEDHVLVDVELIKSAGCVDKAGVSRYLHRIG